MICLFRHPSMYMTENLRYRNKFHGWIKIILILLVAVIVVGLLFWAILSSPKPCSYYSQKTSGLWDLEVCQNGHFFMPKLSPSNLGSACKHFRSLAPLIWEEIDTIPTVIMSFFVTNAKIVFCPNLRNKSISNLRARINLKLFDTRSLRRRVVKM
jgi:hypothetical protein